MISRRRTQEEEGLHGYCLSLSSDLFLHLYLFVVLSDCSVTANTVETKHSRQEDNFRLDRPRNCDEKSAAEERLWEGSSFSRFHDSRLE